MASPVVANTKAVRGLRKDIQPPHTRGIPTRETADDDDDNDIIKVIFSPSPRRLDLGAVGRRVAG